MTRGAIALILTLSFALALPLGARAQIAVGGQAGTTGLGGTAALGLGSSFVIRGSATVFPFEPEFELDEIDYTTELPTPQFLLTADFHPGGGGFYIAGGLHFSSNNFSITAEPTTEVEIGDNTYQPDQIGSLFGTLDGDDVAPYVGIGFGNPVGEAKRLGIFLDLGVSFIGDPEVRFGRVGPDLDPAIEAQVQADLDREAENIQDDAPGLYPVINLGITFKLGGGR